MVRSAGRPRIAETRAKADQLHKAEAIGVVIDEQIDVAVAPRLVAGSRSEEIERGRPEFLDVGGPLAQGGDDVSAGVHDRLIAQAPPAA